MQDWTSVAATYGALLVFALAVFLWAVYQDTKKPKAPSRQRVTLRGEDVEIEALARTALGQRFRDWSRK